jgi:hypothetical protein
LNLVCDDAVGVAAGGALESSLWKLLVHVVGFESTVGANSKKSRAYCMTTQALLHGTDDDVFNGGPVNMTEPTCDRDGFVAWLNLKLAGLGLDALYSSYLVSMLEQGADASSFIRNLAAGNVSPQVQHSLHSPSSSFRILPCRCSELSQFSTLMCRRI